MKLKREGCVGNDTSCFLLIIVVRMRPLGTAMRPPGTAMKVQEDYLFFE